MRNEMKSPPEGGQATSGGKKTILVILSIMILITIILGIFFYFRNHRQQSEKTDINSQNAEISLIAENVTISPDYQDQYKEENSVYIACQNGKKTIKYRNESKEMQTSDYHELWRVLEENDVWNLKTGQQKNSGLTGAGTETITIESGDKKSSFAYSGYLETTKQQKNIVDKIEELKNKYFQ